jgi:hypothetical protein
MSNATVTLTKVTAYVMRKGTRVPFRILSMARNYRGQATAMHLMDATGATTYVYRGAEHVGNDLATMRRATQDEVAMWAMMSSDIDPTLISE